MEIDTNLYDSVICVIPARRGSVGIHRKNMQQLGSYPLFVYSVLHAKQANIPDNRIIVSSDDEDVLEISYNLGVVPHRRSPELSTSISSTEDTLINVLETYDSQRKCKAVITLQPTSPIRFKGLIAKCLEPLLLKYQFIFSSLTCTKFYNFMWSMNIGKNILVPTYSVKNRPMRQSLTEQDYFYFDNGCVYVSHPELLRREKQRIDENANSVITVSELEGMQIDTVMDLKIFRSIFEESLIRMCVDDSILQKYKPIRGIFHE